MIKLRVHICSHPYMMMIGIFENDEKKKYIYMHKYYVSCL